MNIEVDVKVFDEAFRESLKWHYEYLKKSYGEEDNKKLIKALKRVYNYYSPPLEHIK